MHVAHLPIVEIDELLFGISVRTTKIRAKRICPNLKRPIVLSSILRLLAFTAESVKNKMPLAKVIHGLPRGHCSNQGSNLVTPTAYAIDLPQRPTTYQ